MKWNVIYKSGLGLFEDDVHFSKIETEKVKSIFFIDDKRYCYGIDVENFIFFINNQQYDFKIKGNLEKVLQYKSASIDISSNQNKIKSWNLGIVVLNEDNEEKYILSIDLNKKVYLYASKKNNFLNTTQEKVFYLK